MVAEEDLPRPYKGPLRIFSFEGDLRRFAAMSFQGTLGDLCWVINGTLRIFAKLAFSANSFFFQENSDPSQSRVPCGSYLILMFSDFFCVPRVRDLYNGSSDSGLTVSLYVILAVFCYMIWGAWRGVLSPLPGAGIEGYKVGGGIDVGH